MRNLLNNLIFVATLAVSGSAVAIPTDFDFSGTFANDNDVVELGFTVNADSNITIFSSSWISGDSGLGFDPILAIWDSLGNLVQEQDDGGNTGSTMSNGVSYNHGVWDTYFSTFLAAGSYTASIAQFDNFRNGGNLSAGFMHDGNPDFTFDNGYGTQAMFNGVWSPDDARSGDWEFHILNVDQAVINNAPEPSIIALLGLGLIGIGAARRKS
jgi:hypothetical protein